MYHLITIRFFAYHLIFYVLPQYYQILHISSSDSLYTSSDSLCITLPSLDSLCITILPSSDSLYIISPSSDSLHITLPHIHISFLIIIRFFAYHPELCLLLN